MALFREYVAGFKEDWRLCDHLAFRTLVIVWKVVIPALGIAFILAFGYVIAATSERIERPWPAMRERATVQGVFPLHRTVMNGNGQTFDRVQTIVVMRCTHGEVLLDEETANEHGDAYAVGDAVDILHAPVTRVRTFRGKETFRTTDGMKIVSLAQ